MKIICTKEEYRSLILGCADTVRSQYCNMCAFAMICERDCDPGDWLSELCEIALEDKAE